MDLASLDATMGAPPGKHHVMARKQHGGQPISLTDQQYRDLITVQLADWLEQVHCALHTPLSTPADGNPSQCAQHFTCQNLYLTHA